MDTNIIIEAVRTGCWNALTTHFSVQTVENGFACARVNAVEQRSQPTGPQRVALDVEDYPEIHRSRLRENAPAELILLGDRGLLRLRKTALFCSARTPGDAILRAHDAARRMRDEGITVISGFHSPIERECLQIPAAQTAGHHLPGACNRHDARSERLPACTQCGSSAVSFAVPRTTGAHFQGVSSAAQ